MSVSHKCLKSALGLSIFLVVVVLFASSINAAIATIDNVNNPVSPRAARNLESGRVIEASGKARVNQTNAPFADSDVDAGFNASVGEGAGYVEDTIVQPDGKIIVAGSFISVNGEPRGYLTRLNSNGSIDRTFNPGGEGPSGAIVALARQPDGKILIGGNGVLYNGVFRGLVTRLNADGTPDPSFISSNSGANSTVETIAVQSDGKILIGGFFTTFNGTTRNRIARLNADGSLDTTFDTGNGFNNPVFSIVQQPDGKILVGGAFRQYNSSSIIGSIVRLNLDSSLDTTFNPSGVGANSGVETIVLQPDGRILVGGFFSSFNGTATPLGIVRLNNNGTVANAFTLGGLTGAVTAIALLPNGAFLAGGTFNNGIETSRGIASFDFPLGTSFSSSSANGDILSIAVQTDGKLLVGGSFTQYNNEEHRRLVRLNAGGTVDNTFSVSVGTAGIVNRIAVQPDGKIIVAGDFQLVGGVPRNRIARLNADGSPDTTFNTGSGANAAILALALQPDGKILIGGLFTAYNDTPRNRVARLNADGSLDETFNPSRGFATNDIVIQPDGKILLAGAAAPALNSYQTSIVRLNPNGSLDSSFGATLSGSARAVRLQADGKVLLGGIVSFSSATTPNQFTLAMIIRLNQDGAIDSTFNNTLSGGTVEVISVLPDGKILIGGTLFVANNQLRGVLRLLPNGSVDETFNNSPSVNGTIRALLVQPDGKILIGGFLSTRIARLNADGTQDASFIASADNFVDDFAIQPDGKIIVGGAFTTFNNVPRAGLVRLQGSPSLGTRRTMFDFDGDGKSDVSVYRPSNGVWYLLNSTTGFSAVQFGIATDKIVPADYDGDGKTDYAVWRNGTWYLLRSAQGFTGIQFGIPGDVPMPADFNGDGRAELAVFRPSNGYWYVLNLANNQFSSVQFGSPEDKPVAADYDGDGKFDYAVYRPSSGTWYMLQSLRGFSAVQFGIATDKPVVGDYDGDGRADPAVYRPENGTWYLLKSTQGFASIQFGISSDLPVPADYDGDGKTDVAVFRPEGGNWYQQKSSQGFAAIQFGSNGDKPSPNAYVP